MVVDFGVGEFADFVEVTEGDEEDAGTNPVLAEGPPMVALYLTVTGHATRRGSARAHGYKVLTNVVRLDATHKQHTQQILKVRRNFVRGIEILRITMSL